MAAVVVQNPAAAFTGTTLDSSWTYSWATKPTVGNKTIFGLIVSSYPSGNYTGAITATDNAVTPNTYTVRQRSAALTTGYQAAMIVEADITSLPASGPLIVTFSAATASYHATVQIEVSGLVASGAYDTGAPLSSEAISGTTIAVGPTGTLAQAAEFVFSVYSIDGGSATSGIGYPSGWTGLGLNQDASTYLSVGGACETVAATTAVTANWTASTNTNGTGNYGSIATFKIAASGGTSLTPGAGSVALTGYAPTVARTANQSLVPGVGSLAITGYAPTVTQGAGLTLTPGAGSIAITGYAPTISQPKALSPGAGSLTITGYAPMVSQPVVVAPGAGTLALTGYAPSVAQTANRSVAPGVGALTITGYAPSVVQAASSQTLTPGPGVLAITGYAPIVSQAGASKNTGGFPYKRLPRMVWKTPEKVVIVQKNPARSEITPEIKRERSTIKAEIAAARNRPHVHDEEDEDEAFLLLH